MAKAKGLRQKHRRAVEDAIANCELAVRKIGAIIRNPDGRLPPAEVVYLRLAQALALMNEVVSDLNTVEFDGDDSE